MISFSVFLCWDNTYGSWVRLGDVVLGYNISVVDQVVDFSCSSLLLSYDSFKITVP